MTITKALKKVTIYTDGACAGNPGPGGWGAYFIYGDHRQELYGHELHTTNNRMEILAAIKALAALTGACEVALYTDSVYLKNGITIWIHKWLENNWRTSNKALVKNTDLWQTLREEVSKHQINWHWVKGHSTNIGNQIADRLACAGKNQAEEIIRCQS
jgi:ribonuclease HI